MGLVEELQEDKRERPYQYCSDEALDAGISELQQVRREVEARYSLYLDEKRFRYIDNLRNHLD